MEAQGKVIDYVSGLDLRIATEESIAAIRHIGTVNMVFHSGETASLVNRLSIENIGMMIEIPPNVNIIKHIGQVFLSRDYFKYHLDSAFLFIIGQLVIAPDLPMQDIEQKLAGLAVIGQVICPETILGTIGSKVFGIIGQIDSYPPLPTLVNRSLNLDQSYLSTLQDGIELAVIGKLTVPKVLPNDLLQQKIAKLYVRGDIRCHEENASTLLPRLMQGSGRADIIPAGFELIEHPLTLDTDLLEGLPAKKLYCLERVLIAADVSPGLLDERLDQISCQDIILCPAGLKKVFAQKCNLLETRVIFYEGTLSLVEGQEELQASRLEFMKDRVTLVVKGELIIHPGVSPDLLEERLVKVHNLGFIYGTYEQRTILETRMGVREGEMIDSSVREKEAEIGEIKNRMKSANYLVL